MQRMRHASIKAIIAVLAMLLPYASVRPAHAQARLSDKDLEQRIKNVNSDIKAFSSMFNSAVGKTSIRKTTQEKDAKALVQNFQNQSKALYDKFKKTKNQTPICKICWIPRIKSTSFCNRHSSTPQL
jgi:Na+-transporting NADH:ubiquinone oxidoreductase subunit NqrC